MKFEGIYPPVITPHLENGEIDRDGFAQMVEHLVASGVHGVIVGGTTGEYYAQSILATMVKLVLSANGANPERCRPLLNFLSFPPRHSFEIRRVPKKDLTK